MSEHDLPDLSISDEKLCFIIAKAREFDVKDVVTDPDDASNPTDDAMLAVLEDHKDDPVVQELVALINSMTWTSRWIWWRSPGSAAATAASKIGPTYARKPQERTTGAPRPICSAFLFWPIISARRSINSALNARARSKAVASHRVTSATPSPTRAAAAPFCSKSRHDNVSRPSCGNRTLSRTPNTKTNSVVVELIACTMASGANISA